MKTKLIIILFIVLCVMQAQSSKKIAVLGSSLAAGWVTSYETKYDMKNGWAYRLGRLLENQNYELVNISVPGDNTTKVLERIEKDLLPLNVDYVILSLSLSNEGLNTENPDSVYARFKKGIDEILKIILDNKIKPVIGLCYPYDGYTSEKYQYIKKMNLYLSSLEYPSINFLGSLDDGKGHFPLGHTYDKGHPNNRGHEEMFYSIEPTLFENYKSVTKKKLKNIELKNEGILFFVPDNIIHSYTISFDLLLNNGNQLFSIENYEGNKSILNFTDILSYSSNDNFHNDEINLIDNNWHNITISHRYLNEETSIYIDGDLKIKTNEKIEPVIFRFDKLEKIKNLLIYRTALNADEINYIFDGNIIQASLVYCSDQNNSNCAASLEKLLSNHSEITTKIVSLKEKIRNANLLRSNEPAVAEKTPINLQVEEMQDFLGDYQLAPEQIFNVFIEKNNLFVKNPYGDIIPLFPESKETFFVKSPVIDISVTFERDENKIVNKLILKMGEQIIPIKKL